MVVKPENEGILRLHNHKGYGSPAPPSEVAIRRNIKAGFDSEKEACSSDIAIILGLGGIIPKATLEVVTSELFSDITERTEISSGVDFGTPDKEKLCVVQEKIKSPYLKEAREYLLQWD